MSPLALRSTSPAATSDILAPSMATESPLTELENLLGPRLFGVKLGNPPPIFAGRFALLEIRGHGARGLVVKARDTTLDRHVALKLFPFPEASLIAEAQAEAQTLARLSHPNIVAVLARKSHQHQEFRPHFLG